MLGSFWMRVRDRRAHVDCRYRAGSIVAASLSRLLAAALTMTPWVAPPVVIAAAAAGGAVAGGWGATIGLMAGAGITTTLLAAASGARRCALRDPLRDQPTEAVP